MGELSWVVKKTSVDGINTAAEKRRKSYTEHKLDGNCCLMRSGFLWQWRGRQWSRNWCSSVASGSILDGVCRRAPSLSFKFRNWGTLIKFWMWGREQLKFKCLSWHALLFCHLTRVAWEGIQRTQKTISDNNIIVSLYYHITIYFLLLLSKHSISPSSSDHLPPTHRTSTLVISSILINAVFIRFVLFSGGNKTKVS